MSGDFVLTGISGNFGACHGFFCGQMPMFELLSSLFTGVRNVDNGISGEIVFTASVVLFAVGKQDHYDLRG